MAGSADEEDAKTLLHIPFPINNAIIYQLNLNLVEICLDDTLYILCRSSLCFAKI